MRVLFFVVATLFASAYAGGACTDSADAAIVSNANATDAVAQTCGFSCIASSTPSQCIADCMASKAGLSAACAKCYGDTGVCTKNHCALQCLDPKSSGCLACSKQYCGDAFNTCSGVTPALRVNAALTGACTDSADAAIVSNANATDAVAQTCGFSCIASSTPSQCIADCMASKAGLSAACAKCYGDTGVCTKNHCALQCLDPKSSGCLACSKQFCGDAFNTCAGVTPALRVNAALTGACTDSADAAIVSNADATDAVAQTCGFSCIVSSTPSQCIADCMASKAGLSAACAKCYGDTGVCAKDHCALQCLNPKSSGCLACSKQYCGDAFNTCAGVTPALRVNAALTGKCANAADEAKLVDKATTTAYLKACGTQCKADSGCMVTCMKTKTGGISDTCASCFGDFSTCTVSKCLLQCIADPSSATCQACATQNCEPSLDTCTGIVPKLFALH